MAMRYIKMWGIGRMCDVRLFKWEWRVTWVLPGNNHSNSSQPFRKHARQYKSGVPLRCNPRIERRLVQTTWQSYKDTFGYNAKGNGNGR
jgi:hypothetical protein